MRILFTVPHYYKALTVPAHGSEAGDAEKRAAALTDCLIALHRTFGNSQAHMANPEEPCNGSLAADIDVVVCTTGQAHLAAAVPPHLFQQHATDAPPRLLGYECHAVLAEHLGLYDYYCFLEDDIVVEDPLFFWKLAWFTDAAGPQAALQPNRFELSAEPPVHKLYIDGPLVDPSISPRFQDRSIRPHLALRMLDRPVAFERVDNPHAGCFFLNEAQMQRWVAQPYFLDRAADFWGPLESAATLGLMRTFEVYKPAHRNAGFLEVRHSDAAYLGSIVRYR